MTHLSAVSIYGWRFQIECDIRDRDGAVAAQVLVRLTVEKWAKPLLERRYLVI
jgi:hypothetical protein